MARHVIKHPSALLPPPLLPFLTTSLSLTHTHRHLLHTWNYNYTPLSYRGEAITEMTTCSANKSNPLEALECQELQNPRKHSYLQPGIADKFKAHRAKRRHRPSPCQLSVLCRMTDAYHLFPGALQRGREPELPQDLSRSLSAPVGLGETLSDGVVKLLQVARRRGGRRGDMKKGRRRV